MASVSTADIRDTLNLTPADIPDSKVTKMIKRSEVTLEGELNKALDYTSCTDAAKEVKDWFCNDFRRSIDLSKRIWKEL